MSVNSSPITKDGLLHFLDSVPESYSLVPLNNNKQPIDARGWTKKQYNKSVISAFIRSGDCLAIGLKLGTPSNNTIAIDIDGTDAKIWIQERKLEVPKTFTVYSGKKDRGQYLYKIPANHPDFDKVRTVQVPTGGVTPKGIPIKKLELRWTGAQSVIYGVHPETGSYHQINIERFFNEDLATVPDWVIEYYVNLDNIQPVSQIEMEWKQATSVLPNTSITIKKQEVIKPKQRITKVTWNLFNSKLELPVRESIPLSILISKNNQALVSGGASLGSIDNCGIALANDLVGVEARLQEWGQPYTESAIELLEQYARRCSPPSPNINVQRWYRSANRGKPTPSRSPAALKNNITSYLWQQYKNHQEILADMIGIKPQPIEEEEELVGYPDPEYDSYLEQTQSTVSSVAIDGIGNLQKELDEATSLVKSIDVLLESDNPPYMKARVLRKIAIQEKCKVEDLMYEYRIYKYQAENNEPMVGTQALTLREKTKWIIPNTINSPSVALISGRGGMGKSSLIISMYHTLIYGGVWNGYQCPGGMKALFIMPDMPAPEGPELLVQQGYQINEQEPKWFFWDEWDSTHIHLLEKQIIKLDVQLVMLDTLRATTKTRPGVTSKDDEYADWLLDLKRIAIKLGVVFHVISHVTKTTGEVRGTGAIVENVQESILLLKPEPEQNMPDNHRIMHWEKSRSRITEDQIVVYEPKVGQPFYRSIQDPMPNALEVRKPSSIVEDEFVRHPTQTFSAQDVSEMGCIKFSNDPLQKARRILDTLRRDGKIVMDSEERETTGGLQRVNVYRLRKEGEPIQLTGFGGFN